MGPLTSGNNTMTEVAGKQLGGRGGSGDKGDAEECLEMLDFSICVTHPEQVSLKATLTWVEQCHFCWMIGNCQVGLPSCCWTELDQLMKLG